VWFVYIDPISALVFIGFAIEMFCEGGIGNNDLPEKKLERLQIRIDRHLAQVHSAYATPNLTREGFVEK